MGLLPRDAPSLPSPLELAGPAGKNEPDPELLALPAPPRRERTLAIGILVVAAVAALAMAFALRGEVVYALSDRSPVGVGNLQRITADTLDANANRYVSAEGLLGAAGGIRYERPFVADSFRTLPVAGRADLWVDVRVPAGEESGRWEPPRSFTGRLVRFGAAGPRHRGLASAIAGTTQVRVPASAWLLVDGEDPPSVHWYLVLAAAFLGFAVWNVAALARIVRRLR